MSFLIEKLRITNFLSFFGKYEVNLTPYTAIMCNFSEGKDDFFRALEFVFGSNLSDLRVEKPLDLVHKVLREEFLINRDVHSYVEITLSFLQEKRQLKFSRSIINGVKTPRIEHKISDLITPALLYEEKLSSLGIHIEQKNIIFYRSYFDNVIWGSAEDLERTICTCLRKSYLFEDWKKKKHEVEYLTKLKSHTTVKHYNSMKKSHSVIEKYTKKFEDFSSQMETAVGQILEAFRTDSSDGETSSLTLEETSGEGEEAKKPNALFESKITLLTAKLDDLELQKAFLTSHLLHKEIKLSSKPVNASILQNRISILKMEIQRKENQMSEIWEKIQTVKSELENLSKEISFVWISLHQLEVRKFHQNRFTQYGRFYDYLQPSRYVQLLKQIVGVHIFYAHLCDSLEEAFALVQQLRDLKYEHREVFLPLENYSHKLKDLITASGEQGIQLNTLEELLIFLCKLKHYDLIKEVPVMLQRNFNFDEFIPNDYTIYIQNNFHFGSDGLMKFKTDENNFSLKSEIEIEKQFIRLCAEEETKYRKWDALIFLKWKTLVELNSLENDVFCLKQKWRKSVQKPHVVRESSPAMEIYEEYQDIFKEYAEEREKYESEEQQEEEPFLSGRESSTTSSEESISLIVQNLEEVITQRRETQDELEKVQELFRINSPMVWGYRPRRHFIPGNFQKNLDKRKLFFEKELKKLKKLIREDDLDDFLGGQWWRKNFIASLILDFEEIKTKLSMSAAELQNIATERKRRLYQLFEHCNRHLTNTFSDVLDGALPFIKLDFGSGEEKLHILSCLGQEKINVVDIMHFNTFLKFISAFSLFLEIAKFDKIPFMVIDEIEEYFPHQQDNLTAVIDPNTLEKILPQNENPRFHLLIRVGQYLQHYIKKNTPGKLIRNNGSNADYMNGPIQIICFAKEGFIHTTNHYLWIQNQILPEEYISDNCNSYSGIYEINLGHQST